MRILSKLLIVIIVLIGFQIPAQTMMLAATNWFSPATIEQQNKIRKSAVFDSLKQGTSQKFLQFKFNHSEHTFYVVRMEQKTCKEACLTAFYMDDISKNGFRGVGFFPKKTTLGDVVLPISKKCHYLQPLYFVFRDGRHKGIGLSKCGVWF